MTNETFFKKLVEWTTSTIGVDSGPMLRDWLSQETQRRKNQEASLELRTPCEPVRLEQDLPPSAQPHSLEHSDEQEAPDLTQAA